MEFKMTMDKITQLTKMLPFGNKIKKICSSMTTGTYQTAGLQREGYINF